MENSQKYGLGLIFVSVILLVIVLGVYFVSDTSDRNTQRIVTKAAQKSPNLSIITPKIGQELKGKSLLSAEFKTIKNIQDLKGVFKIGEGPTLPLVLSSVENENITASGEFDTSAYINGEHDIKVYIYEVSSNKILSIAQADFPVTINN